MRTEIIPEREAGGGLQGAGQAFLHAGAERRAPQAAEAELALAPKGAAIRAVPVKQEKIKSPDFLGEYGVTSVTPFLFASISLAG